MFLSRLRFIHLAVAFNQSDVQETRVEVMSGDQGQTGLVLTAHQWLQLKNGLGSNQ